MDPTLVPGTRFESQFKICVYEHAILRIYISFFFPTIGIRAKSDNELWLLIGMNPNNLCLCEIFTFRVLLISHMSLYFGYVLELKGLGLYCLDL